MKNLARYVVLGALFLIPLVALVAPPFSNGLFFPFITGKNFAFRIIVEVAVAAWALLMLADKRYRPQKSWTMIFYSALVLWMVVADALAVNPAKAFWSNFERMDGFVTLIHVFLFFVVAGSVLTVEKRWRSWWLMFVGVSAVVALYSVGQLLCYGQACGAGTSFFAIHQSQSRIDGNIGNAAYLAVFFLFSVVVALWQGLQSKGWLKWTLFVVAALEIVLIFFTETRGAIIGGVLAAIVGAVLWALESGKGGRRAAVSLLLVLVVASGGLFLARDTQLVQGNEVLARVSTIGLSDLSSRFQIWGMVWHGFLERPIQGWGQEGFNYVFQKYYEPSMYAQEPWFDRAHNTFLDWLVAGGLPAFGLFLALLASAFVALYRRNVSRAERILLVSGLVAYAVQALVVFDNLMSYIPLAAFLAMAHMASARTVKKFEELPEVSGSALTTTAAPAALVIGVALIWLVNVPSMNAGGNLINALSPQTSISVNLDFFKKAIADGSFANQEIREQLASAVGQIVANQSIADADKQAFAGYAIDQMSREVALIPADSRIRIEYATLLAGVGDATDAEKQFEAAVALSPKKQTTIVEDAIFHWTNNDAPGAEKLFDEAYQLDTSFLDLAANDAAGMIAVGNVKGGLALLQEKFGTTTVDNNALVVAYYQAKLYGNLIAVWELRVRESGTSDNLYRLATAYAVAGRLADATATIQTAVQKFPNTAAQGQSLLSQLGSIH